MAFLKLNIRNCKYQLQIPYFMEYNVHTGIVHTWIYNDFWQKKLFFKNNFPIIHHCKFIHHKTLSQLPSKYSAQGIFQRHFPCKKVHPILDKIRYLNILSLFQQRWRTSKFTIEKSCKCQHLWVVDMEQMFFPICWANIINIELFSGGSTVVEHLPYYPNDKGSSPAVAAFWILLVELGAYPFLLYIGWVAIASL